MYTSTDSIIWEKDASYEYYKHAPLTRSLPGEQFVQDVDYLLVLARYYRSIKFVE